MPSLPVLFEENKWQFSKDIKFLSRGNGFNLFLNANETVFQMPDAKCEQRKTKSHNPEPVKLFP